MKDHPVFQSHTERNIRRLRTATAVAYLVAFCMLAATFGYAMSRVLSAHGHLEQVMTLQTHKVRLIRETQVASYRRADTVQLMIVETDPFKLDETFMAFLKAGFDVGEGRNKIRAQLSSDEERAVLARQDAIIAEAIPLHDQIADLAMNGRQEQARTIFLDQVAELHESGHATFQILRDLQSKAAGQAIATANKQYNETLNHSIFAIFISLAASIGIGLLTYQASGRITDHLRDSVGNLRRLAMHDTLTGLLNRSAITQLIERQFREDGSFALLYMDLDGFKQINDKHGHHLGDQFLMLAAARIRGRMRGIDTVARLGGDEFVAVMQGINNTDECEHAARHIIEAFKAPFVHEQIEAEIGVSIGGAIAPANGRNAAQILKAADHAMYLAKNRGSNCYLVLSSQVSLSLSERATG